MKRSLRFFVPLACFVALVAMLGAGLQRDPKLVPSPLVGKAAPEFALPRLDDPAVTLQRADLLGKAWVLNVWASWCVACRQEHPLLTEFARTRHVPLVGLNYKDARPAGQAWLAQFGNPYDASLFDEQGRVGIDFGVYGVPETFVIDRHGVVRLKHVGVLTPQVLHGRIEPLLKELDG